jgi:hypothetical protein
VNPNFLVFSLYVFGNMSDSRHAAACKSNDAEQLLVPMLQYKVAAFNQQGMHAESDG